MICVNCGKREAVKNRICAKCAIYCESYYKKMFPEFEEPKIEIIIEEPKIEVVEKIAEDFNNNDVIKLERIKFVPPETVGQELAHSMPKIIEPKK